MYRIKIEYKTGNEEVQNSRSFIKSGIMNQDKFNITDDQIRLLVW